MRCKATCPTRIVYYVNEACALPRVQIYNEIQVVVILETTPSSVHPLRCDSGLKLEQVWVFWAVAMAGGAVLLSICLS